MGVCAKKLVDAWYNLRTFNRVIRCMAIGFIGQGWIGKHYADDFEARGYAPVRYALEEPYRANKEKIKDCDIVFIAVPTPTTAKGFDDSIVRAALGLVGQGKIAVVKSTLLPGTTESLQAQHTDVFVLHSPEFLVESSAAHDAAHPVRNLVGIPLDNDVYRQKAKEVLAVLPHAPYEQILQAKDAELIKYAGNCFLYTKVVFMNMLYDTTAALGGDWALVREALIHDPRVGESHTQPIHQSGRGAGGDCFIKDFEAFRTLYAQVGDVLGSEVLRTLVEKNVALLRASGKDLNLLEGVYGRDSDNSPKRE